MGDKVEPRRKWIEDNVKFTLEESGEIGVLEEFSSDNIYFYLLVNISFKKTGLLFIWKRAKQLCQKPFKEKEFQKRIFDSCDIQENIKVLFKFSKFQSIWAWNRIYKWYHLWFYNLW